MRIFTLAVLLTSMLASEAFAANGIASLDGSGMVVTGVTAGRALISDGSGNMAASSVTSTVLGYCDATSSVQGQLNNKFANDGSFGNDSIPYSQGGYWATGTGFKYSGNDGELKLHLGNSLLFYNLANTFRVKFTAPAGLAASYALIFPLDDGTSGQVLSTDGSGVMSWATPAGAVSEPDTQVVYGTGAGVDSSSNVLVSGGEFQIRNNTNLYLFDADNSAAWLIKSPAAMAATLTLTLPTTDGSTGQLLQTDGSGVTSWVTPAASRVTGDATLVAGTVTVSDASVTAGSRIFLTAQNCGGTCGDVRVSARVVGTSFTILSSNSLDTSLISYERVEP